MPTQATLRHGRCFPLPYYDYCKCKIGNSCLTLTIVNAK